MQHKRWWLATLSLALAGGLAAAGAMWYGLNSRSRGLPVKAPPGAETVGPLLELASQAALSSRNEAPFEAGNIGRIEHPSPNSYVLHLRSDNDDALPDWWRQWFYLRLDDVPLGREVSVRVEGGGLPGAYLPFYSYDDVQWIQFKPPAEAAAAARSPVFTATFTQSRVWVARYVPYSYSRLQRFLAPLAAHPAAQLAVIGQTPQGRDIPLLTITAPGDQTARQRVVIHARTHPGEVASSFVLEGLISFLLGPTPRAEELRSRLVFTILPMLNIDGVVAGNNRVSPQGVNLEGKWFGQPPPSLDLDPKLTPPEVQVFHRELRRLIAAGPPVTMALNLHASASEPKTQAFAFPHFGATEHGYSAAEAELYHKQIKFIKDLAAVQGADWVEGGSEGGRAFLKSSMPERWWWEHFGPKVVAMTLESTVGYAGSQKRWMKPNDLRAFGAALAEATGRFHLGARLCAAKAAKNLVKCR